MFHKFTLFALLFASGFVLVITAPVSDFNDKINEIEAYLANTTASSPPSVKPSFSNFTAPLANPPQTAASNKNPALLRGTDNSTFHEKTKGTSFEMERTPKDPKKPSNGTAQESGEETHNETKEKPHNGTNTECSNLNPVNGTGFGENVGNSTKPKSETKFFRNPDNGTSTKRGINNPVNKPGTEKPRNKTSPAPSTYYNGEVPCSEDEDAAGKRTYPKDSPATLPVYPDAKPPSPANKNGTGTKSTPDKTLAKLPTSDYDDEAPCLEDEDAAGKRTYPKDSPATPPVYPDAKPPSPANKNGTGTKSTPDKTLAKLPTSDYNDEAPCLEDEDAAGKKTYPKDSPATPPVYPDAKPPSPANKSGTGTKSTPLPVYPDAQPSYSTDKTGTKNTPGKALSSSPAFASGNATGTPSLSANADAKAKLVKGITDDTANLAAISSASALTSLFKTSLAGALLGILL